MATTNDTASLAALRDLGLSEIDARVYAYLLQNEPSTGYRISHAIGKPTANTYKAIASLEQLGAVQVEDGENRLVRAVPPREFVAQLDRSFRGRRQRALSALSELSREGVDDRLYSLRSVEQVLERASAMIRRARSTVVADLFPGPLRELEKDLRRAATRGVRVAINAGEPDPALSSDPVVTVAAPPDTGRVRESWPGQQLTLVVDAEEHLLALLDRGMTAVHQAVWSRSTFLSCLHHNHVAMEIMVAAWRAGRVTSLEEAERRLREVEGISLLRSEAPGLRRLQARFGGPAKEDQ